MSTVGRAGCPQTDAVTARIDAWLGRWRAAASLAASQPASPPWVRAPDANPTHAACRHAWPKSDAPPGYVCPSAQTPVLSFK